MELTSRVSCKKLGADIPATTCISRQQIIADKAAGHHRAGQNLSLEGCIGCETGLKLFKERGKMETEKLPNMKRCSRKTCLKRYPATSKYFGSSKSSPDGLDFYCIERRSAVAKDAYRKKKQNQAPAEPIDDVYPEFVEKREEKQDPGHQPEPRENVVQEVQEQECIQCHKMLALTAENFRKDITRAKGFKLICKPCNRVRDREITAVRIPGTKKLSKNCIVLDFGNDLALLEKVKLVAKKERRSACLDQQILCLLEGCF